MPPDFAPKLAEKSGPLSSLWAARHCCFCFCLKLLLLLLLEREGEEGADGGELGLERGCDRLGKKAKPKRKEMEKKKAQEMKNLGAWRRKKMVTWRPKFFIGKYPFRSFEFSWLQNIFFLYIYNNYQPPNTQYFKYP